MSDEAPPVSSVGVADALKELNVKDVKAFVAEMTLPELSAVEAAEKEGQDRKGVYEAIEARRAELTADDTTTADDADGDTSDEDEAAKVAEAATGGAGTGDTAVRPLPDDGEPAGMSDEDRAEREKVEAQANLGRVVDEDELEEAVEEDDVDELNRKSQLERARNLGIDDLPDDASLEDVEQALRDFRPDAPASPLEGEEVPPVIRPGDWVRLAVGKGVPKHLVNQDAIVTRAPVHHAQGGDEHSPAGYEFQYPDEEFSVKMRDSGEELTITRAVVALHGTQVSELGFRS